MTTPLARRTLIRTELAALLSAELVAIAEPVVQAVFPCMVVDFKAQSPVVVLGSAGTERVPFTLGGTRPELLIDCWVYVLYADVEVDSEGDISIRQNYAGDAIWTEEDSEATLDWVEELIGGVLEAHPRGTNWKSVDYAMATQTSFEIVGEQMYRRELIPVRFRWF